MKLLRFLFFMGGFAYPWAIIWHIILGSFLGFLIGGIFFDYAGYGYGWPVFGALTAVVAGFLVYLWMLKHPNA